MTLGTSRFPWSDSGKCPLVRISTPGQGRVRCLYTLGGRLCFLGQSSLPEKSVP